MGYKIKIGQLTSYREDGTTFYDVFSAAAPDERSFSIAGSENEVDLTYKDFEKMAETIGGEFAKRFVGRGSWLLNNYPGYFRVTAKEIKFFEQTLAEYQARADKPDYAAAVGNGLQNFIGFSPDYMVPGYDWIGERLSWFIYWMKWAKANCSKPVVHFS